MASLTYLEDDWRDALAGGLGPIECAPDDVQAAVDAIGEARRALLVIAAGEKGAAAIAASAVRRMYSLLGGMDPL